MCANVAFCVPQGGYPFKLYTAQCQSVSVELLETSPCKDGKLDLDLPDALDFRTDGNPVQHSALVMFSNDLLSLEEMI